MSVYNEQTVITNLPQIISPHLPHLPQIEPHNWYNLSSIITKDIAAKDLSQLLSGLKLDSHQIILIAPGGDLRYLGSGIINYLIRQHLIYPNSLPYKERYLNPLDFAMNLEINSKDLKEYKSPKNKELVELVMQNGSSYSRIDVAKLGHFNFKEIDHRKISELDEQQLIRAYKFSKHPDYLEVIFGRYQEAISKIAGSIVKKIFSPLTEIDELKNEGVLGLIKALDRYSFDKGVDYKFMSFAELHIRGTMIDYLRNLKFVPRRNWITATKIKKFMNDFISKYGRNPTDEEIKTRTGISEKLILNAAPLIGESRFSFSLDEHTEDDRINKIHLSSPESSYSSLLKIESEKIISRALSNLAPKEQEFILLYFYEDKILKEVGKIFGYTESNAFHVRNKILKKLRQNPTLEELI